jgi:hypothetical protein
MGMHMRDVAAGEEKGDALYPVNPLQRTGELLPQPHNLCGKVEGQIVE